MVRRAPAAEASLKMSELVRESGVSKELVHHYLREGLLPRPASHALYSQRHLRLLRLIKRLREERFLPLTVIREIVTIGRQDPDRIEVVLLSGSELTDSARQAATSGPTSDDWVSREDVEARTGAPRELVDRCLALGLVRPLRDRFVRQEVNVIALARQATAMGIPLDALRNVRSYVESAFELEWARFMPPVTAPVDLATLGPEVSVRKEIANAFVANVLSGLIDRQVSTVLERTTTEARTIDARSYRPSEAFLEKHGVLAEIDAARSGLRKHRRDVALLRKLLQLFFLAGRSREIVFTIERGPASLAAEARLHGFALLMIGETRRSIHVLERAVARRPSDGVAVAYLAAARFRDLGATARVEVALPALRRVATLAESALEMSSAGPPDDAAEVRLMCGWLLAAMPSGPALVARGIHALSAVHALELPPGMQAGVSVAAHLRRRIASAAHLHRALDREDLPAALNRGAKERREALVADVLRLDPVSEIALEMFMNGGST
jgi:DNA-binding transcriptional MerR regulator